MGRDNIEERKVYDRKNQLLVRKQQPDRGLLALLRHVSPACVSTVAWGKPSYPVSQPGSSHHSHHYKPPSQNDDPGGNLKKKKRWIKFNFMLNVL